MKIIFEYEDGTYRIVPGLQLSTINEYGNPSNLSVDKLISDMGDWPDFHVGIPLVNKYIVADGNRLAGFVGHRDIVRLREEINQLTNEIKWREDTIKMCQKDEDLVAYKEKAEMK